MPKWRPPPILHIWEAKRNDDDLSDYWDSLSDRRDRGGGGLSGFGMQLPLLESVRRQLLLGTLGICLIVAGMLSEKTPLPVPPTPAPVPPAPIVKVAPVRGDQMLRTSSGGIMAATTFRTSGTAAQEGADPSPYYNGGWHVTKDAPELICIELFARTSAKETNVQYNARLTALEEYKE